MSGLDYIRSFLGEEIDAALSLADKDILSRICEIRIRKDSYFMIVIKNTSYFLTKDGEFAEHPTHHSIKTPAAYLDKLFLKLCDFSVYANADNIKRGFVTLKNGARVGIAGTAVTKNGEIISVRDITSLNIRIPREVRGCSIGVLNFLYVNAFPSVIVAGAPSSGKTTLLRDMAYQLSSGFSDRFRKVAVVDERGELAGKTVDGEYLDVGINTDVLTSFQKAEGIEIATRTLSPEMIICDEVSRKSEVAAISEAFAAGISFVLSVHIGSKEDLYRKEILRDLLETGEFSYIVLLLGNTYKTEIMDAEEVYHEICRTYRRDICDERCGRFDVR